MKRQQIVAGNWKMNLNLQECKALATSIIQMSSPPDVLAVLCPPFVYLNDLATLTASIPNLQIGAQNCHQDSAGAYTGEVSASMLKSIGCSFVIIGHSERRADFNESDDLLSKKIDAVLAAGLRPIFCCGEKLDAREANTHEDLVRSQIENAIFQLASDDFSKLVIAYEPVWAIGTGKTATPRQAQEMHQFIRSLLLKKYGKELSERTSILYGGSCKPDNAAEIFSQPDVDGGLIGGASLKANDFVAIVNSFPKS